MFLTGDIQKSQHISEELEQLQEEEGQNNNDSDLDESFLEQLSQNHLREQNKEDTKERQTQNCQNMDNVKQITQNKINQKNQTADSSSFLALKKEYSITIKGFIISLMLLLISYLYSLGIKKTFIILTVLIISCFYKKGISLKLLNYLISILLLPQQGYLKLRDSIFQVYENTYLQFKKSLTFIRETELLLNRMRLGTPSQIIQKFERIAETRQNQQIDQKQYSQNSEQDNLINDSYKNQLVQFQFSCINLRTQTVELLIEVISRYISFLKIIYFLKKSQSLKIKCQIFESQILKKSIQIENISNLWNTFCDIVEYSKSQFNEELFCYYLFILIGQMKKIYDSKNALEKGFQFFLKQEMQTFQESDEVKKINQEKEEVQLLPVLKQKYSRECHKYKLTLKALVNCTIENTNSDQLQTEQIQTENCNEFKKENLKSQNQKFISEKANNQKQNNHTVFLQNGQDWLIQLRDQLNLQMQNMIQINDQINQQLDFKLGLVNHKNQQQSESCTINEGYQNQEVKENIFENVNDQDIQNDQSNTKNIIKVFEANTFIDDQSENQQEGLYFGKSFISNKIQNQVDFLGEMKEFLQQKQKKPVIEQKIILDSEEERINYEKNKINMQDIAQQRQLFQQANKISLLSELKFVMNK